MTRDEILNMPAGLRLNELIAEYVMKLDRTKPGQWRESVDWWVNGLPSECPDYSTDISAAWQVVEKFYSMTFDRWSNGKEFRCYLVTARDGKNCDGMAVADTAPLAICRAALLAVMEDDE